MDFLSALAPFVRGLLVSTLLVISMMVGTASSYITSLSSAQNPPQATQSVTIANEAPAASTPSRAASSSPTAASSTIKKLPIKTSPATTSPAAIITTPSRPLAPIVDPEAVNTDTRKSIVNILCTIARDGTYSAISGSGVIIDPRGVILTNAHIGQYFLLRDYPTPDAVDCVIRMGSPAQPVYKAVLAYLPPVWIDAHAAQINLESVPGTGENDYAFLVINATTDPAGTLPAMFPGMVVSGAAPDTGNGMLIAGYPAGFLDGIILQKSLYATSAFTAVGQLYSYNLTPNVDAISLGGTVVAQGGASGGAVVRTYDGKLTGIIATATEGTTTSSRDLRAITIGHIDRSLASLGMGGFVEFLSRDMGVQVASFATKTFAYERQKLISAIEK